MISTRPTPEGRKPISVTLQYAMPVIVKTHLGGTPKDFFSNDGTVKTPYVACDNNRCGALPQEVYRWQPMLNDDGTPILRNVTQKLQDAPASPWEAFGIWGGLGAGIGGTLGVLVGGIVGDTTGAAIGGGIGVVLGAAIPGTIGAKKANRDRIRLEWQVFPITEQEYKGYRESARPATVQGRTGFWHSFTPVLENKKLGEYKVPKIVHYTETETKR